MFPLKKLSESLGCSLKKNKKNFVSNDSLLIDDTPVNIDDWRRGGGVGILHTDAMTTIGILKMYT